MLSLAYTEPVAIVVLLYAILVGQHCRVASFVTVRVLRRLTDRPADLARVGVQPSGKSKSGNDDDVSTRLEMPSASVAAQSKTAYLVQTLQPLAGLP